MHGLDEIEKHTGARFAPLKFKSWQAKDELPAAALTLDGATVFHYPEDTLANVGADEPLELVDRANDLIDHFPFNDRAASGRAHHGDDGSFIVELTVEAYDPGDDDEDVVLCWLPIDAGAVLAIAPNRTRLQRVLGPLPAMERVEDIEETTLGAG